MAIYSGFLRITIHIYAAGCVLLFTYLGAAVGSGASVESMLLGSPDTPFDQGSAFGAFIGLVVGLFVAASVIGVMALLFEIRDSLKAIRDGQSMSAASSKRQRIEPAL